MRWLADRAIAILASMIVLLSMGLIGNSLAINEAFERLRVQARDGDAAHDRQCVIYPISRKVYLGAYKHRLISRRDLELVAEVGAPRGCPPKAVALRNLRNR